MLINNRIIWKDNATLRDISDAVSTYHTGGLEFVFKTATDYLYIGSDLPFNHRYFELAGVNAEDAALAVDIWDGSDWAPAVDIIDQSKAGDTSLAQDGIISWVTDRQKQWGQESTTEDIPDLATFKIYNFYWVRLKWSADLTESDPDAMPDPLVGLNLKYVGHCFSRDEDMFSEYADLDDSQLRNAVKTGKLDWHEQAIAAAEYIVKDLRRRYAIKSPAQIFSWEFFNAASIHKTAEIIFKILGDDYDDERITARESYEDAMNLPAYGVDQDEDGHVDLEDQVGSMRISRR